MTDCVMRGLASAHRMFRPLQSFAFADRERNEGGAA